MGILDELKRLARPDDDYYEDEFEDYSPKGPERVPMPRRGSERNYERNHERNESRRAPARRSSYGDEFAEREKQPERERPAPQPVRGGGYFSPDDSAFQKSNKVVNIHATTQLQVVLVKPERFENAAEVADHLREKCTVVLNLEQTDKEIARRLIDFLSGVAYAQEGKIKKVAISTYIITPYNVDILGDLIDELENNGLYF